MPRIERTSLMPLETYARERPQFRARVMEHKKNRTVHLGEHVTLIFEDELTIRYQIQEMLRAERIFEEDGIRGELDAYNPLVPDGRNLKATMMLEYTDPEERARRLAVLKGIERKTWIQVGQMERTWAIADEDLDRENEEKTSSVATRSRRISREAWPRTPAHADSACFAAGRCVSVRASDRSAISRRLRAVLRRGQALGGTKGGAPAVSGAGAAGESKRGPNDHLRILGRSRFDHHG
jgi:hypothetical protein